MPSISSSQSDKKFTPKIDRFEVTVDATTAAKTIDKVGLLALFPAIPATSKIVDLQVIATQDNGTVAGQINVKSSPNSLGTFLNVNDSRTLTEERYPNGQREEIDNFKISLPVGSMANLFFAVADSGVIANV